VRQTSEPLTVQFADLPQSEQESSGLASSATTLGDESSGGNANRPRLSTADRRDQLERGWSTSDISGSRSHNNNRGLAQPAADLQALHTSWANTEAADFWGATLKRNPPQAATSLGSIGTHSIVDHASLNRNISLGGPKIDSNGISSVIHDAARITDWNQVLELCKTCPQNAQYAGRDGWTALHHACNRRCPYPDVVEALIHAYPGALLQEDEKSWLPLHYACRFKAPKEVVRLLLHMHPESGKIAVSARDRQGRTPLYYAVRYDAPEGVVGLLLQVDPSAVLSEDQNDESPLALVWNTWADKLEGKRIVHSYLPGGFPEPTETSLQENAARLRERLSKEPKIRDRWQKVNMLLKAAFGFLVDKDDEDESDDADMSDDESDDSGKNNKLRNQKEDATNSSDQERKWRIVHATAAVKCHQSLFLLACALHPEQASELDEADLRLPDANGVVASTDHSAHQTALHLAASSNAGGETGKTVITKLLSLYRTASELPDGIDGSLPMHRMVENPYKQDWPTHASILHHFYPRAVQIPDFHGRLPLHRAAAAIAHANHGGDQEKSVIIQLVRCFPQAASHADNTGCIPFHYAAMHGDNWDVDMEAIYNAHAKGIQVRSGPQWHNRLPIHMAASNEKSQESLIHRLIQLNPRCASLVDREGMLPLHLACEQGKAWNNGTQCIYDAYPQAVRQAESNHRGWLPLHMAAVCPRDTGELITKLVELYPEAASKPDNEGRFPLHLACSAGKNWLGGLNALFDANPSALAAVDKSGFIPLQIAALRYCHGSDRHKARTKAVPKVEAEKEQSVTHEEAMELDIIFHLLLGDPTVIQ
jgi:ankyrin repeat protein